MDFKLYIGYTFVRAKPMSMKEWKIYTGDDSPAGDIDAEGFLVVDVSKHNSWHNKRGFLGKFREVTQKEIEFINSES